MVFKKSEVTLSSLFISLQSDSNIHYLLLRSNIGHAANQEKLGGLPSNISFQAQSLVTKATVISTIGENETGKKIMNEMKAFSANIKCIQLCEKFEMSVVLVHFSLYAKN